MRPGTLLIISVLALIVVGLCSLTGNLARVETRVENRLRELFTSPLQLPVIVAEQTPPVPPADFDTTAAQQIVTGPEGVVQPTENAVRLFIVNPEAPDQNQVRHPGIYVQTNVSNTPINFIIDVPSGYIGIVGGFTVDSVSNGVYEALPPGMHNRTITNGFALIVRQAWAQDEWNFRLDQARDYGWAMQHIIVNPGLLQGTPAPAATPVSTDQSGIARQATGLTGTLRFPAGASVCGNKVVLDNGKTYTDVCFHSAPSAGSVTNGVIYPWDTEFKASSIDPQ